MKKMHMNGPAALRATRCGWRALALGAMLACAGLPAFAIEPAAAMERLKAQNLDPTTERLVQYAAQGDATIVDWLLAAGVPAAEAEPHRQVTPLHNAVAQGHERVTRQLIAAGARLDAIDWQGNTPLTLAAYAGRTALVALLLDKGARVDVDVSASSGLPVLCAAVYGGNAEIIRRLLAQGASVRETDPYGNTAAAIAQRLRRNDLEALVRVDAKNQAEVAR